MYNADGNLIPHLDAIPNEFHAWVGAIWDDYSGQEASIMAKIDELWQTNEKQPTRKDFALAVKDSPYKSMLFARLGGADPAEIRAGVVKTFKPKGETEKAWGANLEGAIDRPLRKNPGRAPVHPPKPPQACMGAVAGMTGRIGSCQSTLALVRRFAHL